MQTTLRIDDDLYRAAKVAAANQGTTLTRFLEDAIRGHLKAKPKKKRKPHILRVYSGGASLTFDELKRIANEEQEKYDLKQFNLAMGIK